MKTNKLNGEEFDFMDLKMLHEAGVLTLGEARKYCDDMGISSFELFELANLVNIGIYKPEEVRSLFGLGKKEERPEKKYPSESWTEPVGESFKKTEEADVEVHFTDKGKRYKVRAVGLKKFVKDCGVQSWDFEVKSSGAPEEVPTEFDISFTTSDGLQFTGKASGEYSKAPETVTGASITYPEGDKTTTKPVSFTVKALNDEMETFDPKEAAEMIRKLLSAGTANLEDILKNFR